MRAMHHYLSILAGISALVLGVVSNNGGTGYGNKCPPSTITACEDWDWDWEKSPEFCCQWGKSQRIYPAYCDDNGQIRKEKCLACRDGQCTLDPNVIEEERPKEKSTQGSKKQGKSTGKSKKSAYTEDYPGCPAKGSNACSYGVSRKYCCNKQDKKGKVVGQALVRCTANDFDMPDMCKEGCSEGGDSGAICNEDLGRSTPKVGDSQTVKPQSKGGGSLDDCPAGEDAANMCQAKANGFCCQDKLGVVQRALCGELVNYVPCHKECTKNGDGAQCDEDNLAFDSNPEETANFKYVTCLLDSQTACDNKGNSKYCCSVSEMKDKLIHCRNSVYEEKTCTTSCNHDPSRGDSDAICNEDTPEGQLQALKE